MDQEAFDAILVRLCDKRTPLFEVNMDIQALKALANTSEIRDFTWIVDGQSVNIYSAIWAQLSGIWRHPEQAVDRKTEVFNSEQCILSFWNYIVTLPEYDHVYASRMEGISDEFIEKLMLRIVYASVESSATFPAIKSIMLYLKRLLHWVYKEKSVLRPKVRSLLGKYLLTPNDELLVDFVSIAKVTAVSGAAALAIPIVGRSSAVDAGSTMSHIPALLDILHQIIAGFSTSQASTDEMQGQGAFFTHLLQDVLLPLHKPNQMVAWRDQIPVLQVYHEPLVRCVLKLVEKDSQLRSASGNLILGEDAKRSHHKHRGPVVWSTPSVLVLAAEGILNSWPDRYDTNTPKQVLLLHELEMLLEKASKREFKAVKPNLLRRLVRCIGTDADNIRPAQRALQMFKNSKILDLFVGSSQLQGSSDAGAKASPAAVEDAVEVVDTLSVLLPAMYRAGTQSWNPTVNKMTGLALKNLQSRNEEAFKSCCQKHFSSRSGSNLLSFPVSSGADAKASPRGTNLAVSTGAAEKLTSIGEKARDSPDAGAKADAEAMNWMVQSMSSEADAKSGAEGGVSGHGGAGAGSSGFPIPRGRPMRPPVAMHKAGASTTSTTVAQPSVAAHSMSGALNFDRSKPPPVTITGVAPWAMMGAAGAGPGAVPGTNTNTSMGISTTSMPASRPVRPLAFNPGAKSSNAPPNSLSCTIQEAKRARQEAAEQQTPHVPGHMHASSEGGDGYQRMCAYIEQCLPTQSPRTPAEEEAARLEDWQNIQAAASPTLLPNLKFHDLVFGTVLGEGAFSVVKYARHITKDKSQSAWPEYAVKIIQAAKIAELSYRSSVIREMAVLQLLSHPGVARLVSAFRYSDSAYMVLEYAARGDLHSYLMKHGKVAHKYCRFIVGEIAAAVSFLHELGFSYGDLKPENVLITELGHIKITDFGACRPASAEAKELLSQSEHILETIRNGDWKAESPEARLQNPLVSSSASNSPVPGAGDSGAKDSAVDNSVDERLEGTPAYLPPEVLKKRVRLPGRIADAWALGCLTYFCLHGRPKYFGDAEQVLAQIDREAADAAEGKAEHKSAHVSFVQGSADDAGDSKHSGVAALINSWEESAAEDFINALTDPDHRERLSIPQSLFHTYLTRGVPTARLVELAQHQQDSTTTGTAGAVSSEVDYPLAMDPQSLHLLPPLKLPEDQLRSGAELADQQWSRRQFSVLWAPMPADYQMDDADERTKKASASGRDGDGYSNADVWLMTHAYTLSPIDESSAERFSHFI